jgi:class 3 adenylate cyclase
MARRVESFLNCASCGNTNPEGVKFCGECGAALSAATTCPSCGSSNPPGVKFCHECGTPLAADSQARSPAPALPASFDGGRYTVKSFLGEGGRKRVYLAHDTKLDRDVAFAAIKTEGLDADGIERVRREAQAMGRLGDHPHIVTIHDVGEEPGPGGQVQPYIVSQYMSGGAVDTLNLPLPIERTLEIAKGACRGLSHAHKNGVVHRDLKPGNVWLTAEGTAKIGDFGLAVALEQSRLTMQGMIVGTVAYMPPEQALGTEITQRADLYSLGCMLYEMVTGKPPFTSDNPTAVISQHINTPPVAPSWHSEACPQALEEIILRLLEKEPADRFASADDVLAALEAVDPGQKAASHSESNVLDRLALGVFVGREQELARLRKAFDSAVAGHGGLVMLVGEPGIGKTRTTQELETYARMRGAQVLWGRTHEAAGAPAYWPWLQAGEQYAMAHTDDLQEAVGNNMPPGAAAELTRIFPWLRGQPNVSEPEPQSDPEVAQFRLFDAYTSYVRAMALNAPVVIALDDLHWADKPTLMMLQHIARELSRMPVLIIGNYRDTDINRQSALSETLATLNREVGFDRIVLRGLTRDEVGAYIRARANVDPRPEVLDKIFEETEGNAFFLSEVVNLMAQEGTLTKDSVSDIAIPDGVREALGRRLNRLREETNELLQVAAIIGREFTYDTLNLLGEHDEEDLLKLVEEALEARVIEETETAGRYRFTHAQMQETLLAELSTTRRVRLHGQVGEALEKRYGARAEERASRLALHFAEASTLSPRFSQKAAHYSALAGRQSLAASAYPEASRHFRAALSAREGQEIDDEIAELLHSLGRTASAMADVGEAWRSLRAAFDYYANKPDPQRAAEVAYQAGINVLLVRPTQQRLIERALDLVEEGSEDYGRLNAVLGYSAGMLGNDILSRDAMRKASEVADQLDLRWLALDVASFGLGVAMFHLHLDEAIELGERAVALARELDKPLIEAPSHFFTGGCLMYTGRLDEASRHADACRALTERVRHPYGIANGTQAQMAVAVSRGDWAAAREACERGLAVGTSDHRLLATAAIVACQTGDIETALSYKTRFFESIAKVPPGPSTEYTMATTMPARMAQIFGLAPDVELIRRNGRAVLESPVPGTPLLKGFTLGGLGILAHITGDKDAAAEILPQVAGLPSMSSDWVGQTDHLRGRLLETLGRADEAIDAVEAALDWLPPEYRPYRAEVSYDCARLRLQRGSAGDADRARTLIDESLAEAQALGMKPLVEKILALKLEDQGISTITDIYTSIDRVATAVESQHPDLRKQAAPDGTVTIMFSDIEGSTEKTAALGDTKWMEVLRDHSAIIREQLKAHDGFEVKSEGDGFMLAFQSARKALQCAIAMQRAFEAHNQSAETPVRTRMGLHTGEVIKDGDDFFGIHVNLAARVASKATGGEILASSLLKELTASGGDIVFGEPRAVEFKGIEGQHQVWPVEWSTS